MRLVAQHQHPDVPLPRSFDVTWRPLPYPAWNPAFINLLDVEEPVSCIVMAKARGVPGGPAKGEAATMRVTAKPLVAFKH